MGYRSGVLRWVMKSGSYWNLHCAQRYIAAWQIEDAFISDYHGRSACDGTVGRAFDPAGKKRRGSVFR
jgi:hypothetical protein